MELWIQEAGPNQSTTLCENIPQNRGLLWDVQSKLQFANLSSKELHMESRLQLLHIARPSASPNPQAGLPQLWHLLSSANFQYTAGWSLHGFLLGLYTAGSHDFLRRNLSSVSLSRSGLEKAGLWLQPWPRRTQGGSFFSLGCGYQS